ncbi:hypothetical protein D3C78_1397680 [compost metagenome]
MRAGLFLGGEEAGAFQHDVDLQVAPGQFGRVAVGQHADLVAVDDHEVAVDFDGARELAVGGVVARQVRVRLGIAQVVDGDDFDIVLLATFVVGTQDVAADATVTVDGDANSHTKLLFYKTCLTVSATLSAVSPKNLNNAPAGADSP